MIYGDGSVLNYFEVRNVNVFGLTDFVACSLMGMFSLTEALTIANLGVLGYSE